MDARAADVLLSESAAEALAALDARAARGDPEARSIEKRVRSLRSVLLADPLHGEVVKRERLPRALVERHGLANLYVEDLPAFWRLLYTIVRLEERRYVVVVEIVDHTTYDGWFPGRGRR